MIPTIDHPVLCTSLAQSKALQEAGIDPTTIAAMVGHSTPQTTLTTYSHFFADSKRRASNIIADIIEGKTAS